MSKKRKIKRLRRGNEIFESAIELFDGDESDAREWLRYPLLALGHRKPIDVASTEKGKLQVLQVIVRLMHGVFC